MKFRSILACLLAALLCLSACSSSDDVIYYTYADFAEKDLSEFITLGDYKGLKIKEGALTVSDEAITNLLNERLQESNQFTLKENIKSGTVISGDVCSIDYIGKKDGVAFEGGTGSYDLEIGSGSFIPGFEDGLIGKKIGSTVDLNLTFPENYGKEELNGQDVVFTVTIHSVDRKVCNELTDELATTLDSSVKNANEYMTKLEKELYDALENDLQFELWNTAVENATYADDLPDEIKDIAQATFNAYYYNVATQAGYENLTDYLSAQNISEESYQSAVDNFTLQQTKRYLLALAICQAEDYVISDEEFNSQAASAAANAGYEDTESYYESMGGDLPLYLQLFYQHALEVVRDTAVE